MANSVKSVITSLQSDEVISRAVQFFSNSKWTCQSQSEKIATFQGKPPIPWFLLLMTFFGFVLFIVPGVILYFLVIRKMYKFQNLVVTTKTIPEGSEIDINYPSYAKGLVKRFVEALPSCEIEEVSVEGVEQLAEA